MNDLADLIARWLQVAARTAPLQWVLRLTLLAAGLGACLLTQLWLDVFISPVLFGLAALALVASALKPDTGLPGVFIAVLLVWWFVGGWHAAWWHAAVVALLVGVVHLSAAWAATGPSHQTARRSLVSPLGRAALLYLAACVVGIAVVVGVSHLSSQLVPRGWPWIVVVAAGVAVVAGRVLPRRSSGS